MDGSRFAGSVEVLDLSFTVMPPRTIAECKAVDALCLLREGPRITTIKKIPNGTDLLDALQQIGEPACGWITGVGDVDGVELTVARPGNVQTLSLPGRVSLVSLSGPFGGPFMATLAAATDMGIDMHAGQLTRARAISVTLMISNESADTAKPAHSAASSTPQPPRVATANAMPVQSAAVSPGDDDEEESDVMPQYKDQIEHPVFGLCDVMVVRGDRMKIRDIHGPTRVREIHLSVLKVLAPVERNGIRVFKLVKR